MELWIRSQDREALTKVNMGIMYWEDTNKRNCIVNKDNATGYSILGAYKSKERALEVLDEIQNILSPKTFYTGKSKTIHYDEEIDTYWTVPITGFENSDIQKLSTYVYEMPNE